MWFEKNHQRFILSPVKFFLGLILICAYTSSVAQTELTDAKIRSLRGSMVSFSSAVQKDSLILVCFWATTSDMSLSELNAINAKYEKWKQDLAFKMLAVSTDEGKTVSRIRGVVIANEWKFDVFTDTNGELRQALKSNNLPQAFIIKNNKIIYQQSGYEQGTEDYLFRRMKLISEGKL